MTDIPTPPGGPLIIDERYGTGTINDVPMVCAAWFFNLLPLWFDSSDSKGGGRDIPGQPGEVPFPEYPAPTDYALKGVVNGFCDQDGDAYDDPFVGLEVNNALLKATMCDPRSIGNGTYDAAITTPRGLILSGPIKPMGLKSADGGVGPIVSVAFKLRVVYGVLAGDFATAGPTTLHVAARTGTVTHP